jgi:hypothetical protein
MTDGYCAPGRYRSRSSHHTVLPMPHGRDSVHQSSARAATNFSLPEWAECRT